MGRHREADEEGSKSIRLTWAVRPPLLVLCVTRGTLYDLLSSGQLPSVHIGRARRVPMGELRRFVRERLERDTLQVR